ncbi:MAG: hypothetical protein JWM14_1762 [Chitinophagaceae bacterium]|nr:hypothetical protein [Chitinophagaceae bacterium]
MKFIIILLLNCFFVLYCVMYLTDHSFTRASVGGKIRQGILLVVGLYVIYNILFIYLLKKQKEESGLIYKIIAFSEKAAHTFLTFIQPVQKEFIISIVIAFVLIVIGMLLAGLPGAVILALLQKMGLFTRVRGDSVWPCAILISMLWPLCLPFAVLVKQYLVQRGYAGFAGLRFLLGMLWIIVIVPLVALLSQTPKS